MSENHHYERAISRLHNGTNNEVARAQVEATLALAYEQRTANLLAAFAELGDGNVITYLGTAIGAVEQEGGRKLAQKIAERLGLL